MPLSKEVGSFNIVMEIDIDSKEGVSEHTIKNKVKETLSQIGAQITLIEGQSTGLSENFKPSIIFVRQFVDDDILPKYFTEKYFMVTRFRNELVHFNVTPSTKDIKDITTLVRKLLKTVIELLPTIG